MAQEEQNVTVPHYIYRSSEQLSQMLRDSDLEFRLNSVQSPKRSRMCGIGEKPNRRPLDPVLVIEVRCRRKDTDEDVTWTLEYRSVFVVVESVTSPEAETLPPIQGRERLMVQLVGSFTSDPYRIRNPQNGEPWFVFVFPDLSIRQEGHYRLRAVLYERIGENVVWRASTVTNTFRVYAAKEFPGMAETTPLTHVLKDYGIRVKCSKSIRGKRRRVVERSREQQQKCLEQERNRGMTSENRHDYDSGVESDGDEGVQHDMTMLPRPRNTRVVNPAHSYRHQSFHERQNNAFSASNSHFHGGLPEPSNQASPYHSPVSPTPYQHYPPSQPNFHSGNNYNSQSQNPYPQYTEQRHSYHEQHYQDSRYPPQQSQPQVTLPPIQRLYQHPSHNNDQDTEMMDVEMEDVPQPPTPHSLSSWQSPQQQHLPPPAHSHTQYNPWNNNARY